MGAGSKITIAVDMMSGDHGLDVTTKAVRHFLNKHEDVKLILIGDVVRLKSLEELEHVSLCHADQVVDMDESPVLALKHKKNSSMRLALNLVKSGDAHVAVSAGNTGALVAMSKFVLRTLSGIKRPVLAGMTGAMHAGDSGTLLLDVGATVDAQPEHLHQSALLGSAAFNALTSQHGRPKVGLLNIGAEQIKGNAVVKAAAALLEHETRITFGGFVEGHSLIGCPVDVIVVDGFVGNIVVKTVEGLLKHIKSTLHTLCRKHVWLACFYPILRFVLRAMLGPIKKDTGALLLGVKGLVVKAHGGASVEDWHAVLHTAKTVVENDLLTALQANMAGLVKTNASDNSVPSSAEVTHHD